MKRTTPILFRGLTAGLLVASALTPLAAAPTYRSQMTITDVPMGHIKTRVTLNVDNAPIQLVLRILFRRSGQNYVLGPHVTGTVTAGLHNIRFSTAVAAIVAANSVPLVETIENGTYVIHAKPPPAPIRRNRRTNRRMNRRYSAPAYAPPVVLPRRGAPPAAIVLPGTGNVRVVP